MARDKIASIVLRMVKVSHFVVGLMVGALLLSEEGLTAEAPPFRAWWPIVNQEVEAGGRGFHAFDSDGSKDGEQKQKRGFGVGFTDWLFLELEATYVREPGQNLDLNGYELGSRIELTETKAFNEVPNLVDVGLLLGISVPDNGVDPYEIESGLLLYKRAGPWRMTGNLLLEKEFGNSNSGDVEMGYAGQVRYRLTPSIQPGVELFGRLGVLGDFSVSKEQQKVGPGVFGFIEVVEGISLKYELSWLFGYTNPTPRHSLKWLLEFEYKY